MNDEPYIIPVILSGGMGTRLWPLSREDYPKQFWPLNHADQSLFQNTVQRVSDRNIYTAPVIVGNTEHRFLIAEQLRRIHINDATIILEPNTRNTAPAAAIAAHYIRQHYSDDALMLLLPSDHHIRDLPTFTHTVQHAATIAKQGYLTTFGIPPNRAETGYGYIKHGAILKKHGSNQKEAHQAFALADFIEKPSQDIADSLLSDGGYSWNSGMFCFPASLYLSELRHYQPQMTSLLNRIVNLWQDGEDFLTLDSTIFSQLKANSIDYAVMEHTNKAAVLPLTCGWTDIGSWDELWRIRANEHDSRGNLLTGNATAHDSRQCYIHSENNQTIATLGVENLLVVATHDAVLVADKSRAQDIKQLVEKLKVKRPHTVCAHNIAYRPWGRFEVIERGKQHQVKRITVSPKESLSMQMHFHRAEHWIILSGTALVSKGDETTTLRKNQSIYIPSGTKHRLHNPDSIPLELIEVQTGNYLAEDDIIRFEDNYGRNDTAYYAQQAAEPAASPFEAEMLDSSTSTNKPTCE